MAKNRNYKDSIEEKEEEIEIPKSKRELEREMLSNMTRYDRKKYLKAKQLKKEKRNALITKVICSIVGILMICTIGYSIYLSKLPYMVVANKYKISDDEFNFYYTLNTTGFINQNYAYLSYFGLDITQPLNSQVYNSTTGETWEDYFKNGAVDTITQIYSIYDVAKENNYIDNDLDDGINEYLDSFEKAGSELSLSLDDYIKSYFGNSMDKVKFRNYLETYIYSMDYSGEIFDNFDIEDARINEYYEANRLSYDTFDFLMYYKGIEVEGDVEDEILKELKALNNEACEGIYALLKETSSKEEFIEVISSLIPEDDENKEKYNSGEAISYKNTNMTYYGNLISDWVSDLFRREGDIVMLSNEDGGNYFIYFESRNLDTSNTRDVRHILIMPKTINDENGNIISDGTNEAKAKIDEIYDEWINSEKTEDVFASMAKEYSEDTGSSYNGGLYEGVAIGDMVEEFEDWLFDSSRKYGDFEIVETSYGFHLMYYVGENRPFYILEIDDILRDEMYDAWVQGILLEKTINK